MSNDRTPAELDVSLNAVLDAITRRWLTVAAVTLLAGGSAFGAALLMPREYRAQVTVMPMSTDAAQGGGVAQLMRGLGGLASVAGIGLGGGGSRDEVVEYLRSRSFTLEFMQRHRVIEALYADDWDAASGKWKVPEDDQPTVAQAYKKFTQQIRSIDEDKKTGIVKVGITFSDRRLASEWANALVADANAKLRTRAIEEAEKSVRYLSEQAGRTTVVPVQEAISRLTEEQLKTVMLANVRDEYAFKVIDPALVPEPQEVVRPRRMLMLAVGLVGGFVFAALLALALEHRGRRNVS